MKDRLETILKYNTLLEFNTNELQASCAVATNHFMKFLLPASNYTQDYQLTSFENATVSFPAMLYSISNLTIERECAINIMGYKAKFQSTEEGHNAAIQFILNQFSH